MKMNGLSFFRKTSGKRCWNVASYHSPHSLTWSWVLSFSRDGAERHWWPLIVHFRMNTGSQWCLRLPWVGVFVWHRQQPMWFRDMFWRRQREDEERKHVPTAPRQATEVLWHNETIH